MITAENISVENARSGKSVLACNFRRVDRELAEGYIYQGWANNCAKHLTQAMEKK